MAVKTVLVPSFKPMFPFGQLSKGHVRRKW
ncbi:hypothetical protein CCACVL1_30339 [Corchorus capsularis]|uniref:Uncharacterized protein n=1 Tax=Corchorus capsularis TaxID=210143 RepID=A0A1R3FXP6_COCAP|nr:hypothetical protein CCACVL1_30339 [Corchorus capsularis]